MFLYVTLGLPARGGHSSNKCDGLWVDFDAVFSAFFPNGLFFQMHYIYVAKWRHNFREIAVKNCEKSKNRRKSLCAPSLIDS